jgi:hypothetical protein
MASQPPLMVAAGKIVTNGAALFVAQAARHATGLRDQGVRKSP